MCGITGIFTKEIIDGSAINQSLQSIKHRGPDNSLCAAFIKREFHFLSNDLSDKETSGIYQKNSQYESDNWIGFNRLSIIDLSNNGMQPFYDPATQTAFMLNGEVYNFSELKENYLKTEPFNSQSDTEVAFKLYLKFGDDFIHKLRGMFVIMVVEYSQEKVKIWRDRFGVKPLYYTITDRQFIFCSEMKGIFQTGRVKKEIEPKHLAHVYYLHSNFAPNTLYKNVMSLEAGMKLEVDTKSFRFQKERYWRLEYQPYYKLIEKEEFISDLNEIIQLSTIADVKQSLMLSGGLDSGILAHLLSAHNPHIEAITIYNKNQEKYNEYEFAKKTAHRNRLKLLAVEIPDQVNRKTLCEYAVTEEEPSGSIEPAYFLSKKAAENNIRVLYNALGLDELFYGYKYYGQVLKFDFLKVLLINPLKHLLPEIKSQKYDELTKLGIYTLPFVTRSPMSWKSILELFGEKDWEHPVEELMYQVPPAFNQMPIIKQLSWLDFHFYISSYHSFRSDQPSMKHSIEMRFPFLDHLFVQKYFNQTNLHQDLTPTNNKPFLRKNAAHLLDEMVLNMPKRGFSMPQETWITSMDEKDFEFEKLQSVFPNIDLSKWANNPTKKWFLFSTVQNLTS